MPIIRVVCTSPLRCSGGKSEWRLEFANPITVSEILEQTGYGKREIPYITADWKGVRVSPRHRLDEDGVLHLTLLAGGG
ncbi:hypothetical protein JW905_12650 [bacterium]|nr:hypothetical protein [candidate division CSSED10-310 bacterium]